MEQENDIMLREKQRKNQMPQNERLLKRKTSCVSATSLIYYFLTSKFYGGKTPCDYVRDYLELAL